MEDKNLELFSRLKPPEKLEQLTDPASQLLNMMRPAMTTKKFIEDLKKQDPEQMVILIVENPEQDEFIWYPEPEVIKVTDKYQSYTAIKSNSLSRELYPEKGIKKIPLKDFQEIHSLADYLINHFQEYGLSEGATEHELKPLDNITVEELKQIRNEVTQLHDLIIDLDAEDIGVKK